MVSFHSSAAVSREPGGLLYFRSFLCEAILSHRLGFKWSDVPGGVAFEYLCGECTLDHDIHDGNVISWAWGFDNFVHGVLTAIQCTDFPSHAEHSKDTAVKVEFNDEISADIHISLSANTDGQRSITVRIVQMPVRPLAQIADAIWEWPGSSAFDAGKFWIDSNGDVVAGPASGH